MDVAPTGRSCTWTSATSAIEGQRHPRPVASSGAVLCVTTALARYAVNPLVKAAFMLGVAPPGYALLETTGRKSGVPRRTPVGYAREDDVVWLVAEHGRRAGWVRNIEATPRVRVKLGKRWYNGSAHAMPDDDARKRLGEVGTTLSRATVRVLATDLLTVRVALR